MGEAERQTVVIDRVERPFGSAHTIPLLLLVHTILIGRPFKACSNECICSDL